MIERRRRPIAHTRQTKALTKERTTNSVLRRVIAELSLELEQAREELAQDHKITRLPTRTRS
ncbi:MAG TPA: hypothetical protein VFW64_16225 [Pseudonocardiaceae bacterium]|nr:hypothetical protein [Pseudonocardiaceae bacterium]